MQATFNKILKWMPIVLFFLLLLVDRENILHVVGYLVLLFSYTFVIIIRILYAKKEDFLEIENFKEKMAEKVYNNIQEAIKNVDLPKIMVASNLFGHGMGIRKLTAIIKEYPDITKGKISKDKLIKLITEIEGFDTITATMFAEGLPKFKEFLKSVPIIKISKFENTESTNNKFKDITVVFTEFRNKDWEKMIVDGGGKVTTSVTSNTTILLTKDKDVDNNKTDKAEELGVTIMTMNDFSKKYKLKSNVETI